VHLGQQGQLRLGELWQLQHLARHALQLLRLQLQQLAGKLRRLALQPHHRQAWQPRHALLPLQAGLRQLPLQLRELQHGQRLPRQRLQRDGHRA
jgi:hypothetical protein